MATKGDISNLDHFMFGGKYILPLINGSGRPRSSLIRSDSDGAGFTRQRKIMSSNIYEYDVTYYFDTLQELEFSRIFFIRNEGKKFIGHAHIDRPIIEPYVMQVISDWEESDITDVSFSVNVTLEVMRVRDRALDEWLFGMYQTYGNDYVTINNLLKEITNELPDNG